MYMVFFKWLEEVTNTVCRLWRAQQRGCVVLPGFSKWVANDIYGSFAFGLRLLIERDVRHFFAWIEEGILSALRQNILGGAHHDGKHKGSGANARRDGCEKGGEQIQTEEHSSRDKQSDGRDQGGDAPAKALR